MCTTYVAARIADRIAETGATVTRKLLVRLNPAVKRKTRGNAALAIHSDCEPDRAYQIASETIGALTAPDDRTSPGLVVAACEPDQVPDPVVEFYLDALRQIHDLQRALELARTYNWKHDAVSTDYDDSHDGYGRIGAIAAIGAWKAFEDCTYEHISYRELHRCGTPRDVTDETVFDAADRVYPDAWDTVDKIEQEVVCVPNAPGPILYGIRGDTKSACKAAAAAIDSEAVERTALFVTNQGTDVHLTDGTIGSLRADAGYRVDGIVVSEPEIREGGHTFFDIAHPTDVAVSKGTVNMDDSGRTVQCAAFEPTKRFRKHIQKLAVGDEGTFVGEYDRGTIKLEKFCIRSLNRHHRQNPTCSLCGRRMKSAGRNQGFRCRACNTSAAEKAVVELTRNLERGWYEVPPCARRHVAKPLIRGGFDAPTHPER